MNFNRKILAYVTVSALECCYQYPTNMYFVSTGTNRTEAFLLVLVLLKAQLKISFSYGATSLQQSIYSATILSRNK